MKVSIVMGCVHSGMSRGRMSFRRMKTGISRKERGEEETEIDDKMCHLIEHGTDACSTTTSVNSADDGEAESVEAPRPDTEVLRRAASFDRAHEQARRLPSLHEISEVRVSEMHKKLLSSFEEKERSSRIVPKLLQVTGSDFRNSKLYGMVRSFEERDAKAREETALEKTLSQRTWEQHSTSSVTSPSTTSCDGTQLQTVQKSVRATV